MLDARTQRMSATWSRVLSLGETPSCGQITMRHSTTICRNQDNIEQCFNLDRKVGLLKPGSFASGVFRNWFCRSSKANGVHTTQKTKKKMAQVHLHFWPIIQWPWGWSNVIMFFSGACDSLHAILSASLCAQCNALLPAANQTCPKFLLWDLVVETKSSWC